VVDADVGALTRPRQPSACQFDDPRLKPETIDLELELAVRFEATVADAGKRTFRMPGKPRSH
jgi:hypothetical protein